MRSVRLTAGCALAVLLLSGCSGAAAGGEAASGRFDSPFALPLESRFVDLALYGAAVDAFMAECMAESGLEYTVGTWDVNQPAVHAFSALGYPNLERDVIEEFGYRAPRDPRLIEPPADLSGSIPPGEEERYAKAQQACTEESRGPVPDIASPANVLLQLNAKSQDMALEDQRIRITTSVERWRECVVKADPPVGDAGGTPLDFRVSVLKTVDAREGWAGTGDSHMRPAPVDEVEAARIDVGCRQQSGYDEAFFSAVGEAQERLVTEHGEVLEGVEDSMNEIQLAIDHYVLEGQK